MYCELGRYPLYIRRNLRIFKFWLKIKNTNNCILKECYENMIVNNDSWIVNLKYELSSIGLEYLFEESSVNRVRDYKIIESRILDICKQNIMSSLSISPKCFLYQHLIDNFCNQSYLKRSINVNAKKYITRFRTSSHSLNIEKGRHNNVLKSARICKLCHCNDIEDEFHFILKCPFYTDFRKKFIKKFYYEKPSVFKLVMLLSVENTKELNNLGKFLVYAMKRRNLALNLQLNNLLNL